MRNVRQADMGEYLPSTSLLLLCLWGQDGEMVCAYVCVCISDFWGFKAISRDLGTTMVPLSPHSPPLPSPCYPFPGAPASPTLGTPCST